MTMRGVEGAAADPLVGQSSGGHRSSLFSAGDDLVVATSTKRGSVQRTAHRTAHALLVSSDPADVEEGLGFMRRVWALLVLQYGTVLLISSPYCLVEDFRDAVSPHHNVLEAAAVTGIVASLFLAVVKGPVWPFAHVALFLLTCFVGLEFGLAFAEYSWGPRALVALGQATTSFSVILALLQFNLAWLTYPTAAILCLALSGLWILVLFMTGASWTASAAIGLGGWAFVLLVLFCCNYVAKHVAPEEHILAVLFILTPEALICVGAKQRHPERAEGIDQETKTHYGGVTAV